MEQKEIVAEKAKLILARAEAALDGDCVAQLKALRVILSLAHEIIDECEGY